MQESIPDQDVGAIGKDHCRPRGSDRESIEAIDEASEAAETCALMNNSLFRVRPSKDAEIMTIPPVTTLPDRFHDECAVFGIIRLKLR